MHNCYSNHAYMHSYCSSSIYYFINFFSLMSLVSLCFSHFLSLSLSYLCFFFLLSLSLLITLCFNHSFVISSFFKHLGFESNQPLQPQQRNGSNQPSQPSLQSTLGFGLNGSGFRLWSTMRMRTKKAQSK